jgi:hypothetical protein
VETVNNSNILKYENSKNLKKFGLFSIILPETLPDSFSPGWSHQPRIKGPPVFCTRPEPRGGPLVPIYEQPRLKRKGFSPALLVPVVHVAKALYQSGLKSFFLLVIAKTVLLGFIIIKLFYFSFFCADIWVNVMVLGVGTKYTFFGAGSKC